MTGVPMIRKPSVRPAREMLPYGQAWAHLPHRMQVARNSGSGSAPGGRKRVLLIGARIDRVNANDFVERGQLPDDIIERSGIIALDDRHDLVSLGAVYGCPGDPRDAFQHLFGRPFLCFDDHACYRHDAFNLARCFFWLLPPPAPGEA